MTDTVERKRCGKLIEHDSHHWWGNQWGYGPRTMYLCLGPPVIEGGHWGLRPRPDPPPWDPHELIRAVDDPDA